MKTPIPLTVVNNLNQYISLELPTLTQKQSNKLLTMLIELWFYVKVKHSSEVDNLENNEKGLKESQTAHLNFTNLHSSELSKFRILVGKSILTYVELLSILLDNQLIERNDIYSSGRFSKSYRPHSQLKYELFSDIEINLEKIFRNNKTREDLYKENPHKYRKLIDDLYLVNIDLEKLYFHLDQSIGLPYSNKTDSPLTPAKAYSLKIQALKINMGIHFFSVSSTGRIYSSIANLPTVILPFLELHNEKVVEIDAVNSQPLLLAGMINHPQFKADVENGCFYEKMAESMGINRQEFKLKSYRWIFFNENKIGSVWQERLDAVYPGLTQQINKLKAERPLWFSLQQMEANIWIKVAQKQLVPVITRHDSILIKESMVNTIKKQIIKEYKKRNLKVSLK